MAICDWHLGQLVVLWVGGAGLDLVLWLAFFDENVRIPQAVSIIVLLVVLGIPVALLIATWKWFGGRNHPREP